MGHNWRARARPCVSIHKLISGHLKIDCINKVAKYRRIRDEIKRNLSTIINNIRGVDKIFIITDYYPQR